MIARDVVIDYRPVRDRRRGIGAPAVNGVTVEVSKGRTIGLVGESGCGKSSLSRALVGLTPVAAGEITIGGQAWEQANWLQRQEMHRQVQMIFQDPFASLNPRWTVEAIIAEPMINFPGRAKRDVPELLELVGLPADFAARYPRQLSGGQRQRVGIARALALDPDIIVADEPVSALDVSVQAQVINILKDVRDELGLGLVFVAHDLAVVRQIADEVNVMYLGEIVERGPVEEIFSNPTHPYTQRLLASVPGA